MSTETDASRVVIAGGGFAALEAAFYLRRRTGGRTRITMISDTDRFLFRPNMIYIPFGQDPEDLTFDLAEPLKRQGVELVRDRVTGIDPDGRRLLTTDGGVSYDYALLATGSRMVPEEVPGLAEHARTIWTPDENLKLRRDLEAVVREAGDGKRQRILFAVPPHNMCSGPLYEIVLMLDSWLREKPPAVRENVELGFVTFEPGYIMAFGPRIDAVVAKEFEDRDIAGQPEMALERVEARRAHFADGSSREFDILVSFPPYRPAVSYDPLPADDRGFVRTESETRRVQGREREFAIGDAGDFPVKQAFLALLEADAAADAIAAEVTGEAPRKAFDPVSLCIMEQFDKATFANVPLERSGQAVPPVRVREGAEDDYQVGSGAVWRFGKKALGIAVPMHFRHGRPFHAGATWKLMEPGLDTMKALFAD